MNSNQELVQMLKDLQIYNSIDNNFSPDHSQLVMVYEKFCDLINFDDSFTLENSTLQLFYRCKLMCKTVGVADFQMMDLTDPDQKRMKHIITQLCKYCIWKKDQSQKWEKRDKEIVQLEDVDLQQTRKQKSELEDLIQMKYKDMDLKKKKFEQYKQMKHKCESDLLAKRNQNLKLQNSISQNQNELKDAEKKFKNLIEKLQVAQNELSILESMVVKDPKTLEKKVNDSQRRVESLQIEVDKCQRELSIETFKIGKIYKQLHYDYDIFLRLLEQIKESENALNQEDKNFEKSNDQIFTASNKILQENLALQKLQQNKEQLQQQKVAESEKNNSSNQYSLQSLIDLQNKLSELQIEVKREQQEYLSIQLMKQEQQKVTSENEEIKAAIEANLKQVVTQQNKEIEQYTKNIEILLNKIEFE
ncbi:unnamed protein product (macronuclear) [Paramecium tetraurelia]|uniref:Kinetochore protein Nuf2 N-terminal domain-containing protein n=1 Tax=Paramecium tetraurelia TaxID=5888 RepID=A0E1F8_PARTE|nr:uncharacterized protein GSPATT00022294001 [Paramecium tetraurelia]CAK89125.1 unnamed protein product [Paramecium tetraurelia]|eukprot:XP_001456522.1 hypothetical protein (macronuclear) [Paramecium tetraurelia strain d4-2]